jgi:integrase
VRRSFIDAESAKAEAKLMARKIMAGQSQSTDLSAPEREAYLTAKKLLAGRSLVAAVHEHMQRMKGVQSEIAAPDASVAFLAEKKQDGASERYLYQLRSDINRLKDRFPGPILQIKSHEIDEWLRQRGGAPRTRNSSLTSIRTFFSWAKSRCYLPKNEETAAEGVPKVRVGDTETGIFTPEQMSKILEAATAKVIPFIVLGAFAGLRAAELTRIEWSAIDLERRTSQDGLSAYRADQRQPSPVALAPRWPGPNRAQRGNLPQGDQSLTPPRYRVAAQRAATLVHQLPHRQDQECQRSGARGGEFTGHHLPALPRTCYRGAGRCVVCDPASHLPSRSLTAIISPRFGHGELRAKDSHRAALDANLSRVCHP